MSNQADATLTRATGPAFAERDGVKISLKEGDAIYESDLITTGSETTIDISFRDGTKSRIGPDSEMRIVDFEFGNNDDASFVVNLTQGAMRTVTGEIVKLNPEAFEVITPRATAGIRGTEFITQVNGDTENHLVLFISGGSVMLVEGNNGSTLSFDKPLQGTSIAADGSMKSQSFTMSEMQSLINSIAPSIGGNIPHNVTEQGDWLDANNLSQAKSSDVVAGREVSIVYDDAETLEVVLAALQNIAGIVINSVIPNASLANVNYQEVTVLDDAVLSNATLDSEIIQNNLFTSNNVFDSLGGQHSNLGSHGNEHNKPTIKPEGGNYGNDSLDLHSGQISPTGNAGDDRYIYRNVGGTINAGDGDNSISISQTYSSAQINAGSGNDNIYIGLANGGTINAGDGNNTIVINSLNSANADITTGSGNDTIKINSYTGGDIFTGSGNDIVMVENTNAGGGDTINTGAGNDIVFIEGANINNKIDMGSGYDVLIHTGNITNADISNVETIITDTNGLLSSSADLKSHGITITNNGIVLDSSWTENNGNYTNSNYSGISITHGNINIVSSNSVYADNIAQSSTFG